VRRIVFSLALALATPVAATAAVIHDNGPCCVAEAIYSDPDTGLLVADDANLDTDATIGGIRFFGVYADAAGGAFTNSIPSEDAFTVYVCADQAGPPGALLGTRSATLEHPTSRARAQGAPYDPARVDLFQGLATRLATAPPVIPAARTSDEPRLAAFIESEPVVTGPSASPSPWRLRWLMPIAATSAALLVLAVVLREPHALPPAESTV